MIPTAALMGRATEELAARSGPGIGGFLNVTFGNAPELIIAFFALNEGLQEVVKASLIGSMLGNILLVMGAAMLIGGRKRERQYFDRTAANVTSLMLLLAVVALIMPALFELVQGTGLPRPDAEAVHYDADVENLSVGVAIILLLTYVAGLVFSLRTHKDLFNPEHGDEDHVGEPWTVRKSVLMLAGAGVAVGVMSEILVGSITEASESIGLSPFFVGIIVVAIVGNAAEHWVAIYFAARDKMDLAVNIAIGSSRPDRAVRGAGARPAVAVRRRLPAGARVQRVRARGGRARGADRAPGDAGGRVDVVRGPPAAGGVRGPRAHLLLRLMAVIPFAFFIRTGAVARSSPA